MRASIKEIVKETTDRLGVDYLDSNFSLFSQNDQEAEMYLSLLKSAVQEVAQDIFPRRFSLEQKVNSLTVLEAPEMGLNRDIWKYNYKELDIFRIYKVLAGNKELKRVLKQEELDGNSYLLGLFALKTSVKYPSLKVLYAPNTFYGVNEENEILLVKKPVGDSDICFLDKELVINKLGYLFCLKRGLEEGAIFLKRYQERLLYLNEAVFENTKELKVC